MKKIDIAFIGGSGLYKIPGLKNFKWVKVNSSFGIPSDEICIGLLNNRKVAFLPRHGRLHNISPTNINYRANIECLKILKVRNIISLSAVGSLRGDYKPGDFVIVDQFIDKTFLRKKTFFDEDIVAHVPFANPVCENLRKLSQNVLKKLKIKFHFSGTYICMEGPQFSTHAESELYRSWGCDVIGMTNMPEAKLAREAEIRYSTVAMVTDYDCWHPDHDEVDVSMVIQTLMKNAANAQNMIKEIIKTFKDYSVEKDPANDCLDVAIITDPKLRTKKTIKKLKNIAGRVLNKKK